MKLDNHLKSIRAHFGLALLATSFHGLSQVPQVHYGPWMAMKDNDSNGIQIAFKLYPDGTMYYKLKNTYSYTAKIDCHFSFTDKKGKTATETACTTTLAPGQERSSGGWWDANVASVDAASLGAKVRAPDAPQALEGAAKFPARKNEAGVQMLMAAQSLQGSKYRKGMQCSDLIIASAKAAHIPITQMPAVKGETMTTSWFMHGMGQGFRPVVTNVTLSQLAQDNGNGVINIPIGSVIVTNGHAALYGGVIKVFNKKQIREWQLITYDANDFDGWTVSLSGTPSDADLSDQMLSFPGHQVGEHVTHLQWGSDDVVSVYQPVLASPH